MKTDELIKMYNETIATESIVVTKGSPEAKGLYSIGLALLLGLKEVAKAIEKK